MRHRADVPDVIENFSRVACEQRRKFAVILPRSRDRTLVDLAAGGAEIQILGRHVRMRAIQPDVALALLFRVVKGVRVKERPNELPADILKPEFEMRVLINGVVSAVKRRGANVDALLVGD